MGFFSWKTSDTNRSISNIYSSKKTFPVYMLVPKEFQEQYGKYIEEKGYEGYGEFGGHDAYALVAIWNEPDRCKKDGKLLAEEVIRDIGIEIACHSEQNASLKYPIKLVEDKNLDYDEVKPSVNCPYQGFFYPARENEIEISILINPVEKYVYIEEPTSSGCTYDYENTKGLIEKIESYIYDYVDERLNEEQDNEIES